MEQIIKQLELENRILRDQLGHEHGFQTYTHRRKRRRKSNQYLFLIFLIILGVVAALAFLMGAAT